MSDEWYYMDAQGGQQGPVTQAQFAQLFQSNSVNTGSYCWNANMANWDMISNVAGLVDSLRPAPAPVPVAAPAPAPMAAPAATAAPAAAAAPRALPGMGGPMGGNSDFAAKLAAMAANRGAAGGMAGGVGGGAPRAAPAPASAPAPAPAAAPYSAPYSPPAPASAPAPAAAPASSMGLGAAISAASQQQGARQHMGVEKLGAPEPVSSGQNFSQPLQIQRRAEPDHGWKALKSADGQEYYYNIKTQKTQWEKPNELKTQDDYERAGDWVWAPHEMHGYVPARVVSNAGGRMVVETEQGQQLTFTAKQAAELDQMKWLQLKRLQQDLVMLDVMNKPLILYNLTKRFESNEIYTAIGTILISINPYKRLPLYTPGVMEEYIRRGNRKLPPHVFLVADDAYKQLLETGQGQSIVISGESGAGKTECTKQALQYIAEIAGSSTSNVEQKILASNPILEAFGNAKTVRNNNSSRFGKYVEIYFDQRAQISGSTNTNYLLEKIRVVTQSQGERNYHAFYQLCRGAPAALRQQLSIGQVSDYWYLSQSGCDSVDDVDDVADYEEVLNAMRELGWAQNEIENLQRTLAGILHLGNLQFRATGDRQCEVVSQAPLQTACALLQLDPVGFAKAVTTRVMRVTGQQDIDVFLSKEEADAARDALAKFIYEKMFDWIVQRINQSIGKGNDARPQTISILDIFGFEIFEHNQFEQLCINFTNEKLQQFFNQHTFKKEEELYRFEGINFTHVNYIDNQPVLDLIEMRPYGILPMVDEEIRMPKGSDKTFVDKLVSAQSKNKDYFKPFMKDPKMFIVEHYAGTVRYDSTGFLEKNRDKLNDDAHAILQRSQFSFLNTLFNDGTQATRATLGTKFARQLNELMTALNATEPHYIRCVKPNPNKAPMQLYGQMTLEQLQYAGVFEAVTIRKQGFPFRYTHTEFFKRYKCLQKDRQWDGRVIENCKYLIQLMGLNLTDVQIGATRVLYRAEQHREMELKRNLAVDEVTTFAQKYCRRVLTRYLRERCLKFRPLLKAAVDSRSIEQIDAAIAQAGAIGFPIYELKQAQRMKFVFREEKRLEALFLVLVTYDVQESYSEFQAAVASADDIELKSAAANQVRQLYYQAKAVRDAVTADAEKQEKVLDEVHMKAIIERADALPNFTCERVENLRRLLYNTSEDDFVKLQLKKAVLLKDPELIQARTVRIKDLFLDKSGNMFEFVNFPQLFPPAVWADIKLLAWDRDELAAGMLRWTDSTIHAPLTQIDEKMDKETYSHAKRMFKNVLGFMGDKKQQAPVMLAVEMLTDCLRSEKLRDEAYCQIIKQLRENKSQNPDSVARGWNLMLCCLHCFPPSQMLENYLQMFFRQCARVPRKFINLMHKTMYLGMRNSFPTESDINMWIAQQDSLDCDDYKTKLAKAEVRMKEHANQMQANPRAALAAPFGSNSFQQQQPGYGAGYGAGAGATAYPGPPTGARPQPAQPGFGSFQPAAAPAPAPAPAPAGSYLTAGPGPAVPRRPSSHVIAAPPPPIPAPAMPAPAPVPVMPAGPPDHLQWYYIDGASAQQGPLDKAQFRAAYKAQGLTGETYCWNDSMAGWDKIETVADLYAYVKF